MKTLDTRTIKITFATKENKDFIPDEELIKAFKNMVEKDDNQQLLVLNAKLLKGKKTKIEEIEEEVSV